MKTCNILLQLLSARRRIRRASSRDGTGTAPLRVQNACQKRPGRGNFHIERRAPSRPKDGFPPFFGIFLFRAENLVSRGCSGPCTPIGEPFLDYALRRRECGQAAAARWRPFLAAYSLTVPSPSRRNSRMSCPSPGSTDGAPLAG
jgi:hypothetical protein